MNPEERIRQISSIKLDPKVLSPSQEGSEPAPGWVVLEILGWIWEGIEVVFALLGAFFHH